MTGIDTSFLIAWDIADHPFHASCRNGLAECMAQGDSLVITAGVLAEFIHVITDSRRFEKPLPMGEALDRAAFWLSASEVSLVEADHQALTQFDTWMRQYRLGRTRILDTLLAASFLSSGATSILTLNPRDFSLLYPFSFPLGDPPTLP